MGKFFASGLGDAGGGDPGSKAPRWMMQVLRTEPSPASTAGSTNAPVPLTSLKTNLVRFLGQSKNHAVAEALDRMAPIRPDAVSRDARAGREGRTPAPLVRLLTQSKRLPGGLEPLVTDFAKGRLPDDYKAEQPSADALERGDGIRVVRGIGAFRETAKTLIASASAGTRPTGMPLQSGGKN